MSGVKIILLGIFLLALIIRFLYFPNNVNFAYDQARDSFAALELLKGDLKIVGPPTTASDKIFHGALFYYILAPIYSVSGNNPEAAAAILRIANALGIFLVFLIASNIFNKQVGLISAFLFAISLEQSQYSLFFGHPALGAVSVLIFYLGLSQLIFKKKLMGLVVALIGLGLTIQFEDINGLLILNLLIFILMFMKNFRLVNFKTIILSILAFLATISTFVLAEFKYQFRTTQAITSIVASYHNITSDRLGYVLSVSQRLIHDNLLAAGNLSLVVILVVGVAMVMIISKKNLRPQGIFLSIWFLAGLTPHFLSPTFSYYYSPGASVSLLILAAFLIYQLFSKQLILALAILAAVTFSNLSLIVSQNYKGPNADIVIQPGMLTSSQRQALDYIYQKAHGQPFAVSALTVPLNVKTTWDYLFNWYGSSKYYYLPVWGYEAAEGFKGNLEVETDRAKLPIKRFMIIEPTVGIEEYKKVNFLKEEGYFSKVLDEKKFGTITVQEREKI